jgi:hypothetical protein
MRRLFPVLILFVMFLSCKKSESDSIWEKSYSKGEALFINALSDSGYIACGENDDHPYLIRFNRKRLMTKEITSDLSGLFSSVWVDTTGYIAAGNTDGKMLLMRYSPEGIELWSKTFDTGYRIDYSILHYNGDGSFLALGTASPDSSDSGNAGLLFVRFDSTGVIISEDNKTENSFISAKGFAVDDQDYIYLALTRKYTGSKPKASVARLNSLYRKLWEEDLYNNPNFGALSTSIKLDGSGNIYVTGATELSVEDGVLDNSFLVSLTGTGSVIWKKYFESSNCGAAIIFDENEDILMMNKNCFVINHVSHDGETVLERIRMFNVCNPYDTDALGSDMNISYDKNFLVAGSKGGNFYIGLKSSL